MKDLLEEMESPFYKELKMAIMPERLKLLDPKYDGTSDPSANLETYMIWMELNSATKAFKCCAFMITLTGVTQCWLDSAPWFNPKLPLASKYFFFTIRSE